MKGERRDTHEHATFAELDTYLGDFIKNLKQKKGKEYEPDSVSSFFR